MGFFNNNNDEEFERAERNSGSFDWWKLVGLIFTLFFSPVVAVSILIFLFFMKGLRWKPSVTVFPLIFSLIILFSFSGSIVNKISEMSLSSLKDEWISVIFLYIYISIIAGIIFGYFYLLLKAWDLKRYPEYVHISGWAYGFKYAPTPLEKWRKKKNISMLKSGDMFDYKKAPIGIIDEPVRKDDLERSLDVKNANKASVVYRYYSEAMAHTLITGKTGSGKALHVDIPIRTKERGWTTVGEVKVGETLYNEEGNHTKLLEIYKPMTPDHYELTFVSGETVKACGDHLWNIGDVTENNTVNTRTLFEKFDYNNPYEIIHMIDETIIKHEIIRIKKIEDNPEDYVCFTVDSPSRLFLITKSYIPTHNTVTMLSLIQNDVLAGHPVCVIDFKKSPDLIYFLSKWAKENDREFYHFVSGKPGTYKNPYKDNQATYDPLSTGGATSKADMILNLRSWDSASEVFKKRTQDVLQSLFFLLERTPKSAVPEIDWDSGGLAQFVSALDLNNFKKMIEYMARDMQAGKLSAGDIRRYNTLIELYKELAAKTKSDLKAQIVELLSIARTLIVSNYGDWLATGASDYHIDLMKIATSESAPVVLFSFNQQEEPEFAKYIGSIVMSDLSRVSALKNAQGDTTPFGVYIDEFQTLDPRTVKDNLEKARSSKMYITLSLQSIDQIVSSVETGDGESMANAILDTCSNFIFHDGSGYDTAEKMSKIIGKSNKYVYKTTSNTRPGMIKRLVAVDNAMVSKDIQEDWLVPPSEFQSLVSPTATNGYKATAYIVNKASDDNRFERGGGALARKVHVVVAEETASGIPPEFKKQIYIAPTRDFEDIQSSVVQKLQEIGIDTGSDDGEWGITDEDEIHVEINNEEAETYEDILAQQEPLVDESYQSEPENITNKSHENKSSEASKVKKQSSLPSINDNFEDIDFDSMMEDYRKQLEINVKKESSIPESINKNSTSKVKKEGTDDIKGSSRKGSQLDMFNQLRSKKIEPVTPKKEEPVKSTDVEKTKTLKKEEGFKLPDLD